MRSETYLVPPWLRRSWRERPLGTDLGFYLGCLVYAIAIAGTNEFYGYRVWGNFAIAGYGLAAAHTVALLLIARGKNRPRNWWASRWVGIGAIGALAMLAPLAILVVRRLTGVDWLITPFSWSAQPEVWVIERSTQLLLEHGTPYIDISGLARAPEVNDYTPYGPVMTVFGLPRELFGATPVGTALTDARLIFALVAVACVVLSARLLRGTRIPMRAAQLTLACPLTALTWSVAGPDLAILGLVVLAGALAATERPLWCAGVLSAVVSAKLIALPAAVVLAVLVGQRHGKRAVAGFLAVLVPLCAVWNVPVFLVDPGAFIEHVVRFPTGLGAIKSPAASPLPGHVIAGIGPTGRVVAFALLALAALLIVGWLIRRPPRTASDAMLRTAVGLGAFLLLTPATRFGYLVYPVVLLGVMVYFRQAERQRSAPVSHSPSGTWDGAPTSS